MTTENHIPRLSLLCKDGWLSLECQLPARSLARGLAILLLAAATAWGGPDLLRFVQALLGQG